MELPPSSSFEISPHEQAAPVESVLNVSLESSPVLNTEAPLPDLSILTPDPIGAIASEEKIINDAALIIAESVEGAIKSPNEEHLITLSQQRWGT